MVCQPDPDGKYALWFSKTGNYVYTELVYAV